MARKSGERARARFVRESADVRRQALIDATAASLAERGVGGTSVRTICARAGVSSGLLTHYFSGVDSLILATYRAVAERVSCAMEQAVEAAESDPRARLRAFLHANFQPPVLDPDLLATWIAFWSLIKASGPLAEAHAEIYGAQRMRLEALLREAEPDMPPATARTAAIALSALVDGLWLELCLDPTTFTAEEALSMLENALAHSLRPER